MQPLPLEHVASVGLKLAEFVEQKIPHTVHVTWRMKATAFEEPGDAMEWHGVASTNPQGVVEISFAQRQGYIYSFPRDDVDYLRLTIKRTKQDMPGKKLPTAHRVEVQPVEHREEEVGTTHAETNHQEHALNFFEMISGQKIQAFVTIAGVKVLRAPGKFSAVYPHVWVEKMQSDSVGGVIAEWRSELSEFLAATNKSESVSIGIENAKATFICWLRTVAVAEELPENMWRMAYHALETILFMVALVSHGGPGMKKLRSELDDQWSKKSIDYPAAMKSVNALKEPARSTETRGGFRGRGNFRSRGARGRL